jgi:RimJ/RimL family protein N-acetyltransferase
MQPDMERLVLESPRLLIRNLRLADLPPFHEYRSNPEVMRYQGFDTFTKQEAEDFIKDQRNRLFGKPGEWVQFGLELKKSGAIIGDCAIRYKDTEKRIGEIGITMSHLEQGKGFATEVMKCIMTYLFDEKGIHRIEEIVDAENIASIRLLQSLGFRKEGHFIENIFFKGKWGSEFQYAMLKREWEELKAKY